MTPLSTFCPCERKKLIIVLVSLFKQKFSRSKKKKVENNCIEKIEKTVETGKKFSYNLGDLITIVNYFF